MTKEMLICFQVLGEKTVISNTELIPVELGRYGFRKPYHMKEAWNRIPRGPHFLKKLIEFLVFKE